MSSLKETPVRAKFSVGGILTILLLAGCSGSPSPMLPASPNATTISDLTSIVFWIAVVVFVVVEGVLLWSVIRFSRNKTPGEPEQIEGNTKFEIAWTAAPAIVLLIVFFISLQALFPLASIPSTPRGSGNIASAPSLHGPTIHTRVIGHRWWWEVVYPDHKIVTANEMHVPVNAIVTVDVESIDVIHSFWVPQLGGKIDAIPGRTNKMWFQPTQVGNYHGQCSEFCGTQHAGMRLEVFVDPPDVFQAWVSQQQMPAAPVSGDAVKGEQVFMTSVCIACHTIDGTKAQGKIGPNLTHLASRRYMAGATMEVTSENLARWLTDPQAIKPGNLMQIGRLPRDQIDALVAYLISLK